MSTDKIEHKIPGLCLTKEHKTLYVSDKQIIINNITQIFLTGSTGTLGKAIFLNLLKNSINTQRASPNNNNLEHIFIIHYFTRKADKIESIIKHIKQISELSIPELSIPNLPIYFQKNNKTINDKIYYVDLLTVNVKGISYYIFLKNYIIGHDGFANDLYIERRFLSLVKKIAGVDNIPNNLDEEYLRNNPHEKYLENKDKICRYVLINTVADKDAILMRSNMRNSNITDVRKHWSINLAAQISKVTDYHFIKFIHISTVYVNKGSVPVNGWLPTQISLGDPPNITDDYIYGYAKAAAENIIMTNDPSALIIRLPGLYDEALNKCSPTSDKLLYYKLDPLLSTSPSTVVHKLLSLNKLTYNLIFTADDSQQRFPISSQFVAEKILQIIEEVKNKPKIEHNSNIINLGGIDSFTKFKFAQKIKETYGLDSRTINASTTNNFTSLPSSELMVMDTKLLPRCIAKLNIYDLESVNIYEKILQAIKTSLEVKDYIEMISIAFPNDFESIITNNTRKIYPLPLRTKSETYQKEDQHDSSVNPASTPLASSLVKPTPAPPAQGLANSPVNPASTPPASSSVKLTPASSAQELGSSLVKPTPASPALKRRPSRLL